MKRATQFMIASALAMSVGSAFAANQTTLKINGSIGTGSCTFLTGGADHIAELAPVDPASIAPNASKQLPLHNLTMSVSCAAPTAIKFEVNDTTRLAAGSNLGGALSFQFSSGSPTDVYGDNFYKLVATNSDILNKPVGAYVLKMGKIVVSDPSAGTAAVDATMATSIDTATWHGSSTMFISSKDSKYFKPTLSGSTSNNATGTLFNMPIEVASTLLPKLELPVTADEVLTFEGTATIDVTIL